ncbi:type VI secretion system baseplate subunit TssF [Rhodobacter sp. NSM]|uniref:type VI secretion system baseplate subunit TssF n=1 Tax=Rhodobacter sp. NSM TaxID=3457501 RepID=UPI003FD04413
MDRAFLAYYESELAHLREMASEFGALHPTVGRNLSLDSVPCPDPYVERLLEGVAWLAARTRLKLDAEAQRDVRNLLDWLWPDLVGPAPAMSLATLHPGPQVLGMADGHRVARGTRLVAAFREGLSTRATYTTAQDVRLWPVTIGEAGYLPDRGALKALGLADAVTGPAEAGIRLTIARTGAGTLSELSLDRLDICFAGSPRAPALFDAIHGFSRQAIARGKHLFQPVAPPSLVGIADDEGLLPRLRPSFEGYRLVREYFLMPDRFHYLRLDGLNPVLRDADGRLEIVLLLSRARPQLADLSARDFRLFVTPVVNLFEKECNAVEIDPRAASHVVHADRTRLRDFEIYRLLRVEDADSTGPEAVIRPLHAPDAHRGSGLSYTTERRPRRPGEDELRRGQTRTSHAGDDLFIAIARRDGATAPGVKRLDIRALCTNRDLPILDDSPRLTLESGDPVARVDLLSAMRRPRPSLAAGLPRMTREAEAQLDEVTWRLAAQLSLDHLSLADGPAGAEPLRAMLELYADRGDPAVARHARSISGLRSHIVTERLGLPGPLCFGRGQEITLDVEEALLSGASTLLLSALLAQLFARQAAINAFVRVRTRLVQAQEEVTWPMTPGIRPPI